jgi:tetratricopeptide (TPR) repeat protein
MMMAAGWLTLMINSQVYGQTGACPAEAKAKADGLVKQAQGLKANKLDEPTVRQAIGLAEQAVKLCPRHEGAWVELGNDYWQIGDWTPKNTDADKQKRLAWFQKGEQAADQALAIAPNRIGGLYWKSANMASAADLKGWTASVWMFPTLVSNMEKIDKIDPHYGYGATKRFWTEVLTRVPLFLANRFGYKPEDVARDLDLEIKREPRYFPNYIYAARLYWKLDQKGKALSYLDYVLKHNPADLPECKAENEFNQKLARQMWKEWTGKEYPGR